MSAVETAARRPKLTRAKGPPIEMIGRNFLSLNINYYRAFIALIASNFVNEKTTDAALAARQPAPALTLDQLLVVDDIANRATAEYLRNVVKIKVGAKNQVDLNYYFNFSIPKADGFDALIAKSVPIPFNKKTDVIAAMRGHQNWGSLSPQSISIIEEMLEDTFFTDYNELVKATIVLEDSEDDEYFTAVTAKLTLSITGAVYSKYVDGDDFSPYLAFMMANNLLSAKANRAEKVYDPRKISSTMASLQKKFGAARARLNAQGFGIMPSGRPIFVPKELDVTRQFIDAGDASIDEDGEFNLELLVEKGYANRIIYVDWLNDILAYTTAHGRLQILNLRGVMELDTTSEKMLLETPITDNDISAYLQVITLSLANFDSMESKKFLPKGFENPEEIGMWGPSSLQARLTAMSGTRGANSDICVKHLAGIDLDRDFPEDTDIKRFCHMFAAHAKMLANVRKSNKEALELPDSMKSQGIYFRLTGVEYYLHAIASYNQSYMDTIHKGFNEEKARQTTDLGVRTFAVPNLHIGTGGLTGLLPHQGRISSSLIKAPRFAIMPVQTGGGKSILSIVDAVYAIQDAIARGETRFRPLISTKGRLVKGTITEINRISHGKLNAIPLRASTFRRMKRVYNIKTFEDLMKWFKGLPVNTVFVNSYTDFASRSKIYDDLPSMQGFANEALIDSQYLRIIKLLNIQMIIGDESHLIKNPDSNRTKGAYSAFSNATHRHIMSGTILSNTAADLIGQSVAVSPAIFGNDLDRAEEKYGISRGIIHNDETATAIKDRMRAVAGYHQATKDEWSYMLPNKADELVFATMTPLQEEFYDLLMREAQLELMKVKDGKGGIKSEEEADEDEEEEEADEDMTAEDAEEEKFLAAARLSLSKVEQFLAAPDMNEQYITWERKPSGLDLISPKVKLADSLIDKHLAKHGGDKKQNKVIVFGVNIDAIKHFVNHSKHAARGLVYFAGDDEIIRQYATDEKNQLLIAAETALREGENLQMTSLIIRLQSVWAPGDHEQTVARMYRPDPRGKYNRESVDHFWTMVRRNNGNPSLDGVKMARLISKFVSNARITYEDRKEWKSFSREVDDLEMLRMNYELIFEAEREDVDPYFAGWRSFVGFENRLNNGMRLEKANELESRYQETLVDKKTGKIIDINRFVELAMAEVTEAPMLAGSKRVFCPWSPNALPPDPDNYGFATLGMQEIKEGAVVLTEFGPGIVSRVGTKNSIKVRLYGDRELGVRRSLVCIPSEARAEDFAKIVKNPSAWAAMSYAAFGEALPTVKASAGKPKKPIIEEEDDIEEDEDDELPEVEVDAAIINGFPALIIMDEEVEGLESLDGWMRVDPFISLSFRNWEYAQLFLETLDSKTYIPPKLMTRLENEIEEIKVGKFLKVSKPFDPSLVRDFFTAQRKKFGKKDNKPVANPYWVAIEENIRLAFDINSHESRLINWLRKAKTNVTGVVKVSSNDGFYLNVFKTVSEARRDLANLEKLADFDQKTIARNLTEINDELKELAKPRKRPIR